MADLTFTTIEEPARAALEISRDEYATCNYIQTWSTHPGNRQPGWCDRTRQQMADFIGISPRGMMKMLDRLEGMDLIRRYSETLFLHQITEKWFETVTLAKAQRKGEQSSSFDTAPKGAQSSPQKGHKVPTKGAQSTLQKGHKVPTHNNIHKENNESAQIPFKSKKIETADDAERIILEWAENEGRESVRNWFSNAGRKCTVGSVQAMVQDFVHTYLTIGDSGKRARMENDPLEFFKFSFKVFLKRQRSFETPASTGNSLQEPQTERLKPGSIRVFKPSNE